MQNVATSIFYAVLFAGIYDAAIGILLLYLPIYSVISSSLFVRSLFSPPAPSYFAYSTPYFRFLLRSPPTHLFNSPSLSLCLNVSFL